MCGACSKKKSVILGWLFEATPLSVRWGGGGSKSDAKKVGSGTKHLPPSTPLCIAACQAVPASASQRTQAAHCSAVLVGCRPMVSVGQ